MSENNTPQDGFSIFKGRQNRSNKSRKDERVNLLNSVADGSLSTEEALRRLSRTYSTGPIRFHHRISRDNRIEISGIVLYEPDRGINFVNFAPRVFINYESLSETGLIQVGSRVSYRMWLATDKTERL